MATVKTLDEHVHDEIIQLILTNQGERPFLVDFGGGVRRLVFEAADEATGAIAKANITQAINRWLGHRVTLDYIDVKVVDSTITVDIRYRLAGTEDCACCVSSAREANQFMYEATETPLRELARKEPLLERARLMTDSPGPTAPNGIRLLRVVQVDHAADVALLEAHFYNLNYLAAIVAKYTGSNSFAKTLFPDFRRHTASRWSSAGAGAGGFDGNSAKRRDHAARSD